MDHDAETKKDSMFCANDFYVGENTRSFERLKTNQLKSLFFFKLAPVRLGV